MSYLYIGTAELKSVLGITVTTQDAEITRACYAASEMVEEYKRLTNGRRVRYYSTPETRYFTSTDCYAATLDVDDFVQIDVLKVDRTSDYTYSETWTASTDYLTEPVNNPLEGRPMRTIVRIPNSGRYFPGTPQDVLVTGTFGWSTAPYNVKEAATILASRYFNRRNAPFGVMALGVDTGAAIRLPRTDPDVAQLLDAVDSNVARLFA